MTLPPPVPSHDPNPGHGPFGETAFRAALACCVVLVVVGLLMALLGDGAVAGTGTALLVLAILGLVTGGGGLLLERILQRRPAPRDAPRSNGRADYPRGAKRVGRRFRAGS